MKVTKVLFYLIITLIFFVGCGTVATIPYSFTENGNGIAEITLQIKLRKDGFPKGGLYGKSKISMKLISIEGEVIPLPKTEKVWNPISLPAEKTLTLTINIFYFYRHFMGGTSGSGILKHGADPTTDRYSMDVIFNCPPLEAGKNYKLEFKSGFQKSRLVLTETNTKKIFYEQVVPNNWKRGW
jgi:hypothetical protein